MDELIARAHKVLNVKPPCDECGRPFLNGSRITCAACLRHSDDPGNKYRKNRLKCDCGQIAVLVIYVKIYIGGMVNNIPLPVCEDCLSIEIDTMTKYF